MCYFTQTEKCSPLKTVWASYSLPVYYRRCARPTYALCNVHGT